MATTAHATTRSTLLERSNLFDLCQRLRLNDTRLQRFQRLVLRFYAKHKRDLPWRRTRDPYHILVSEVMLQQTQVDRVVPKYREFLSRFPTLRSLAEARFADVIRVWVGLGYNGRALRLWQCARIVVRSYNGKLPRTAIELQELPGIGPYTACAVASFAYGAHEPVVDTNVRRVLTRALLGHDRAIPNIVSKIAVDALPKRATAKASRWGQALMDVGAQFCRAKPQCDRCPAFSACAYALSGKARVKRRDVAHPSQRYAGSNRFYRGAVVRALSVAPSLGMAELGRQVKDGFGVSDAAWFDDLIAGLAKDGLVRMDRARNRVRLP